MAANRQLALPGITHRQKLALARVSGAAAKAALRASFGQQNRGQDSHDAVVQRRRAGASRNPRAPRIRMPASLSMPESHTYGRDHFEEMSSKALMQEAWKATPASSNLMAPRGYGYYDAFETLPISAMTHMSIGPATPIDAKTTCGGGSAGSDGLIDTGLSKDSQLLIIQPASSSTQAVLHQVSSAVPTDLISIVAYNSPQLRADPPVESIPARCSIRIGNYTAAINQGGIVRVLRMTTGVALDPNYTDNATLIALMQGIREHRRTRQYKGTQLDDDMQKNCIVADQSRSLTFSNFDQAVSSDLVPWLWTGSPPVAPTPATFTQPFTMQLYDPSFTPIAILFEPFVNVQPGTGGPLGNTYQVVVQSQFLAHYKQGSMLANLAISPASDPNTLNRYRDAEEAKGSALDKIWHGVQKVGQFAWNHRADIGALAPMIL